MFDEFPVSCCKPYACDFCLNEQEIIDKHISIYLKQMRRQNLNERKLLLLGKLRVRSLIAQRFSRCFRSRDEQVMPRPESKWSDSRGWKLSYPLWLDQHFSNKWNWFTGEVSVRKRNVDWFRSSIDRFSVWFDAFVEQCEVLASNSRKIEMR